ncbi:unnamed protein product [Rotaria sp. Silwood2]|nr:unnamed protein product [Rotaria sp. Silwood2]
MNMNTNINTETIKTPSQDAQGRWYDLLSPTQVLTGQEQTTTTTTISKIKKEQPHEATILMYKRANQLKQKQKQQDQTEDVEMEEIIPLNDTMTLPGPYNPQRKITKRKRDESAKQNDTSIIKSLNKENGKEKEENMIQVNINKQTTSLHYYLNATDKKFKQMLKAAFVGGKDILQWYKSKDNLHYLREHTRLVDRVHYLKLEEDLWKNYTIYEEIYHCWTSPLSKTIIKDNKLEEDYKISNKSMIKYRERIKHQQQEAEGQVEKHALLLKDYQHQDSSVDEQHSWAAILALVRNGLHKLSQNHEHRKKYFKNSAKDYSFVKACYDCQPTQDEVMSMQVI